VFASHSIIGEFRQEDEREPGVGQRVELPAPVGQVTLLAKAAALDDAAEELTDPDLRLRLDVAARPRRPVILCAIRGV
jgi:hypothetical protein